MQTIDYVVLISYFAIMVAIGVWAMRRVNNQEDYFMGGRGFGKLMQTFAAFGAGTGAHEPPDRPHHGDHGLPAIDFFGGAVVDRSISYNINPVRIYRA